MSVVGVYDSGIGGLSTLSALKSVLKGQDFFYLADTKNMPFGTKSKEEIYASVTSAMKILQDNSDIQVVACNTASTVVSPKDAFLLRPKLESATPLSTLFLSTPATMRALGVKDKNYATAPTKNLATMVEIMGSLSYKSRDKIHLEYLDETVKNLISSSSRPQDQIDTIVLGCSHYVYIKPYLKKYMPKAKIIDGNHHLILEIMSQVRQGNGTGKITFQFTLGNQQDKYAWMLDQLDKNKRFFDI
jgi:glutamate racemase